MVNVKAGFKTLYDTKLTDAAHQGTKQSSIDDIILNAKIRETNLFKAIK